MSQSNRQMLETDVPRLSRSGYSSPFGKRTEAVKTVVSPEIKAALSQACAEAAMSESEFVNFLLEIRFGGIEHAARIHRDRLELVAGKRHVKDGSGT